MLGRPAFLALVSGLLILATDAPAEPRKPFTVIGLGHNSCGRMVEAERRGAAINYSDWITGAITGYNAASGGSLGQGMDFEAFAVWTKNYCQTHPLNRLMQAFVELTKELEKRP